MTGAGPGTERNGGGAGPGPEPEPGTGTGTGNGTGPGPAPAPGSDPSPGSGPVPGEPAALPDAAPAAAPGDRAARPPSAGPATEAAPAPAPGTTPTPTPGTGAAPAFGRGAPGERRLHPVTPLRRAWAPIAIAVGWVIHDLDQAQKWIDALTLTHALLGLLVIIPAAAAYGFLSWWFTHFSVTDTELRIRTGLLFRRTAHIRLDRLQAVDVTQPLLARVIGVAKLKLDVIGTDAKDELAFLSNQEARELRAELLARAAGIAPESARDVGEAPARQLARVHPRTLAVAILLLAGVWAGLAAAAGVTAVVWALSGSPWPALAAAIPSMGAFWAASAGRYITEYDWTVGESPDGLRLDHGLLDRTHETVPPGRVQTVRIVEPLLWRGRGWVRVELDVAGSKNTVLLPVADRDTAGMVIARVLPGVDVRAVAGAMRPVPRRARWCVPLWWRGYGFTAEGPVFAARHGLVSRTLSLVPHAKVQSVRLRQGPWTRARGLADVTVDTGANKSVTARLRDAAEARAVIRAQADRSRTGRREALPDRWMTGR
ncbi:MULTISPECIES: PH domain-containing protein [Streptomyces]|uniref:PH domain-containing protein n=1 Tax=Streptomyces TaxID=1883 RepID=UPI0004D8C94E|nr:MULTISPECIES: PH domain-containing protein [Streptomyces]